MIRSLPAIRAALCMALLAPALALSQQREPVPNDVLTRQNPATASPALLAKARGTYEENCLQCHGASGKGDGPMSGMLNEKPADLTNPKKLGNLTDGQIYWAVTKGVNPMPNFESKLSENERWELVLLLRSMSKTKPNAKPRKTG